MEKIRVLVVDDSALMRRRITDILNEDRQIEVVGSAKNGEEALKMLVDLKPEVVTLDIEMPKMDGLVCLGYIMSEWPTPVVMLSAYTQYGGQATIHALEYGAVDFVGKPSGVVSLDIAKVAFELTAKVKIAAKADVRKLKFKLPEGAKPKGGVPAESMEKLITIGASTGGPKALAEILPKLPVDIPAGILVVQHMPEGFTKSMAEHLNWESQIHIKEAEDGDKIKPGNAYVAPGDFHMLVERNIEKGDIIRLTKGQPELGTRPAINVTMRSVAPIYAKRNIGVVLTGMGTDGTEGLRMIRNFGGTTIAEHQSTCIVYGMPRSAIEEDVVDKVMPLPLMAGEITRLAKE